MKSMVEVGIESGVVKSAQYWPDSAPFHVLPFTLMEVESSSQHF